MRFSRNLPLAVWLLLGMAWLARGQDNKDLSPRDIVDKAIKAQGNPQKVAKLRAAHAKGKGKLELMGGISLTLEVYFQFPDKFKNVIDAEINGMNVPIIQVFDGKNFWISVMGKVMELKDEKIIKESQETLYLERLTMLVGLTAKDIELSLLGETKIDGRAALGVRASSKGHRDINLHFDKKTFLLLKTEYRGFDAMNDKEINVEKFFSDYKESDGIHWPRRLRVRQDDKDFMQLEITEYNLPEKHDDSVFAKP